MVNLRLSARTAVHFLSYSKKINQLKLSYTLEAKTNRFINISSESLKIIKFMDVKMQVLCTYKK